MYGVTAAGSSTSQNVLLHREPAAEAKTHRSARRRSPADREVPRCLHEVGSTHTIASTVARARVTRAPRRRESGRRPPSCWRAAFVVGRYGPRCRTEAETNANPIAELRRESLSSEATVGECVRDDLSRTPPFQSRLFQSGSHAVNIRRHCAVALESGRGGLR